MVTNLDRVEIDARLRQFLGISLDELVCLAKEEEQPPAPPVEPSKYGFVFHAHAGDWRLALRLAKEIKQHHPNAPVVCIGDGYSDSDFSQQIRMLNIGFVSSVEPLKTALSGWRWTERFLSQGLGLNTPYVLRLDSDARIHRPIKTVPDADLFGGLSKDGPATWPFITGGCIGFRREAIIQILQSEILRQPIYGNAQKFAYPRYSDELGHPGEQRSRKAYYLDDIAIGHLAKALELSLADWDEAHIKFRGKPKVENKAITHPWPNAEKIFGIGLPRTGTLSLVTALNILGYDSQHWPAGKGAKTCSQLLKRADTFDSLVDHPVRQCYRQLLEAYPDALFVLGDRPIEDWRRSMGDNFDGDELKKLIDTHGPLTDWFVGHREDVVGFFKDQGKTSQLLIHDPADGWGPLCQFLGKDVPGVGYPHKNKVRGRIKAN